MIFKYVAGVAGGLALVAAIGWAVTDNSLDRARSDRDTYRSAYENLQATLERERSQAEAARQIEQQYQEALTNANDEIAKLRDAAAAGSIRVLVRADCAAVPATAKAKPGNDAGTAALGSDAQQAFFDLKEQHAQVIAQVKALQRFARLCSGMAE